MDQSTHEIRRRNWMNIINQCKNRPADITAKQWLADNGISDKSYYYWLRKIRLEAYEQLNVQRLRNQQKFLLLKFHFQPMKIILRIGMNPFPHQ